MKIKPTFECEAAVLYQMLEITGYGEVVKMSPTDAATITPHVANHPHTHSIAGSGIPPQSFDLFPNGPTLGLEWIRHEPNPQRDEPPINVNRYLFGLSEDGSKCLGYEVTAKKNQSNPVPGTVFPHWPKDFDTLCKLHFPHDQPGSPGSESQSDKE